MAKHKQLARKLNPMCLAPRKAPATPTPAARPEEEAFILPVPCPKSLSENTVRDGMLHPYDDTVHLSVGAKTLDAQRSVLATTCQFFNDLVASEAAEGAGALKLDGQGKYSPETVCLFVRWAHNPHIHFLTGPSIYKQDAAKVVPILTKAFQFGVRITCPEFSTAAFDWLLEYLTEHETALPDVLVIYIYNQTPTGSPLRQLVLDQATWILRNGGSPAESSEAGEDPPQEFLKGFRAASGPALTEEKHAFEMTVAQRCARYHQHVLEETEDLGEQEGKEAEDDGFHGRNDSKDEERRGKTKPKSRSVSKPQPSKSPSARSASKLEREINDLAPYNEPSEKEKRETEAIGGRRASTGRGFSNSSPSAAAVKRASDETSDSLEMQPVKKARLMGTRGGISQSPIRKRTGEVRPKSSAERVLFPQPDEEDEDCTIPG